MRHARKKNHPNRKHDPWADVDDLQCYGKGNFDKAIEALQANGWQQESFGRDLYLAKTSYKIAVSPPFHGETRYITVVPLDKDGLIRADEVLKTVRKFRDEAKHEADLIKQMQAPK